MEKLKILDENLNEIVINEKDKLVVINLWAIWCEYCIKELSYFDDLYKEYKDKIELYMVCEVESKDEIKEAKEYISKMGYDFKIYFDINGNLGKIYETVAYPTTVFLEGNLNTLAKIVGMAEKEEIEENIQKYMAS